MNQSLNKKWFIAQIKPNSSHYATQNLERQGFQTFLPKMEITNRKGNKFVVKNVYVFPGYIFVYFNPHIISWTKINSTYGVSKILTFNKKPAVISSDLILPILFDIPYFMPNWAVPRTSLRYINWIIHNFS